MATLAGAAFTNNFAVMVACFALSTLAYASFSTIVLALPGDLFPTGSVASVSGLSGTGAGLGTIAATYLTGIVSDAYSFEPILITAACIPLIATLAVVTLLKPHPPT
jgi:ACS family hexuronate transporter-like MFS transporter